MNAAELKTVNVPSPLKDGALPTRFKVLGWGINETSEGKVIVDDLTAQTFATHQRLIGRERVVLDYEHNTVPGSPEYERTREPRDTAGALQLVVVPGEGLFGEAVTYTASGQTHARNFEDLSLAPYLDKDRRVIAAHSVGLTHTGAAYGITFSQAEKLSADGILGDLQTLSALNPQPTPMTEKFISLAAIAGILGCDANADEATVMAKLKAALARPAPELTALSAKITDLESKFSAAQASALDGKRAELVLLFARDGKVPRKSDSTAYSAEELKALSLETLQLLHANTPVTVPLAARGATRPEDNRKSYKDAKGIVDLAALFDDENRRAGLSLTAPAMA